MVTWKMFYKISGKMNQIRIEARRDGFDQLDWETFHHWQGYGEHAFSRHINSSIQEEYITNDDKKNNNV